MARAHICEHQLVLSNFTNEPRFPSTSHDQKTHPSGSKTLANIHYISKFDAHMCCCQLARKTPVGSRRANVTIHAQGIFFPSMWPCVGMIVITELGAVHQKNPPPTSIANKQLRLVVGPLSAGKDREGT